MEETKNNHFCIQPFVNITAKSDGNYYPCCLAQKSFGGYEKTSVSEYYNSKFLKDLKKDLLNGKKLELCQSCQTQEEVHKRSHRQEYNKFFKIKDKQNISYYEKIVKNYKIQDLEKPLLAELHITNLCNLKCLTCSEVASSQIHAENKKLGILENPDADYNKVVVHSMKALEEIIHPNLIQLNVRGGETFIVPQLKKLLKGVSPEKARNITLKIETNGTNTPDREWLDIFRKFKKLVVNISIDAYGEDNHYVRYPSQWSKILKTIQWFKSNDLMFTINTVVSNLNIMNIDKLLRWIQKEELLCYVYVLHNPIFFRPDNLPKECLELAIERLSKVPRIYKNPDTVDSVDNLVMMCKNKLKTDMNRLQWKLFVKEVSMRDKHRGNDITKMIPELTPYFKTINMDNAKI